MNKSDDVKYFIVVDEPENKIIKVKEEDQVSFKEQFGSRILLEAGSIQQLLMQLSEKLNDKNEALPTALFR